MVKFYDSPMAPNTKRARMVLASKGIKVDREVISIMAGENTKPEYLAVNAAGTLPCLVTDEGVTLFENMGIAIWAEATQPEPNLMGVSASEKGEIMSLCQRIDFSGGMAFMDAYRNGHPKMAGRALPGPVSFEQVPELVERGKTRFELFLKMIDSQLDGKAFLVGRYSLADIWAYSMIEVAPWIKMAPTPESHPNIAAWFVRMKDQIGANDHGTD